MTTTRPTEEILFGFTRALRAAGVPVTHDRAQEFVRAAALLGLDHQGTRLAGRATLCAGPDDLERHDQVFDAWFDARDGLPRTVPANRSPQEMRTDLLDADGAGGDGEGDDAQALRAMASNAELLRHRDVATLSNAEKSLLNALFTALQPRLPVRRTARHRPWHRGEVDARRTLRQSLRRLGEPADLAWRRRGTRPRRVVLLIDVSGSMSSYADALLRLAHRFVTTGGRGNVEVFTVGTRLTHITRALQLRDPERALVAAGETVPDWSGGTRLGEVLRVFLDRWGARGVARGAVVVVCSDGWERGDTSLLAEQMARLQRLAHRVVWVNPHRGKDGYLPVQQGIEAALPHCDDFVAGHTLATYAGLVEVVAGA